MKILAIANWKGGVAKTTTAVAMAGALLVLLDVPVILADLDPQGNASLALNGTRGRVGAGGLLSGQPVREALCPTQVPRLGLVPASRDLGETAWRAADVAFRLRQSTRNGDGVLVADTPPGPHELARGVLRAADWIVIPLQPDPFSASGLGAMLNELLEARHTNPALAGWSLLRVLWPARGREARAFGRYLEARHRDVLLGAAIPPDQAVRRAVHAGLPVTASEPRSRASAAYLMAAREVVGRWAGGAANMTPS